MVRRLLLFMFGVASGIWAADGNVGTRKLNVTKSTFRPGPPTVAETRICKAQPKGAQTTVTAMWVDRTSTTVDNPRSTMARITPSRDLVM
jgi:hypothetical protein